MLKKIFHHLQIWHITRRLSRKFNRRLGYKPNLTYPKSYCEKVQWLKLNQHHTDDKVIAKADKYLVRKYLEDKGLGEHLVKLYGVYDKPEEIDWAALPNQFVIKFNNASGPEYRWIVKDKNSFSTTQFLSEANQQMSHRYGFNKGEFHYSKIVQKIVVEEYLADNDRVFKDYSFYCFHGKVVFLSVEEGKAGGDDFIEYYNTRWEYHPVTFNNDHPRPKIPFKRPDNLDRMLYIAETLSAGYPHMRVDLYLINHHIYFGELTYAPESGLIQWNPRSLDYEYGELIDINDISH